MNGDERYEDRNEVMWRYVSPQIAGHAIYTYLPLELVGEATTSVVGLLVAMGVGYVFKRGREIEKESTRKGIGELERSIEEGNE
jgi:hypothetical protein